MIDTEDKDFMREKSTRALINTNTNALKQNIAARTNAAKIATLENDISDIKSSMTEILMLLQKLGTDK